MKEKAEKRKRADYSKQKKPKTKKGARNRRVRRGEKRRMKGKRKAIFARSAARSTAEKRTIHG